MMKEVVKYWLYTFENHNKTKYMKSKKTVPGKETYSKGKEAEARKKFYSNGRIDEKYPLIIWKKPGVERQIFEAALKVFQSKIGVSEQDVFYCEDCDKGLLKL